jgi:hypothetical protein
VADEFPQHRSRHRLVLAETLEITVLKGQLQMEIGLEGQLSGFESGHTNFKWREISKGVVNTLLSTFRLFCIDLSQRFIPDDLPSHKERGENQGTQGTSHVCVGLREKVETPQRDSTVYCPARPLQNNNVSMGNSHQRGDGARSAGPKKWEGREAMASVELRGRLGWWGLRGARRGEQVCQFNSI